MEAYREQATVELAELPALDVEIAPDSTTYTMRVGDELVFRHEDEVVTLTHANPTAVRRTLRP